MEANGHCGYISLLLGLQHQNEEYHSVLELRRSIHEFLKQYSGMFYNSMSFSSTETRQKFITSILNKIYTNNLSEKEVGMEYWFDVSNMLPIVAMMFPKIHFMVYDILLCTTTCCSSCSKDSHTWDIIRYVKIPPISSVYLLYD